MIDTVVQLNGHNSYHATETFWADPFGVEVMAYITVSAAMYATSNQDAADRIAIRFLDANGVNLGETRHSFAIMPLWERQKVTAAVPTGAMLAQVGFLQGAYWWAEAKTEEGEVATPYAVNAAGQLTWISANGIYTGMITANQIILVDATGEKLAERLVTINNSILNMRSSINGNTTAITTIEAGQAEFVKYDDLGVAGRTTINGGNITTGTIAAARIDTTNLIARYLSGDGTLNTYAELGTLSAGGGGLAYYNKAVQSDFIFTLSEGTGGHLIILDRYADSRVIVNADTAGATYLRSRNGNEIGVDSTRTWQKIGSKYTTLAGVSYGTATPTSLAPNEIYIQI